MAASIIALAVALLLGASSGVDKGVATPAAEEGLEVTYGSTVKLMHDKTKHRLHSHDVPYGSGSGQQSVTGFPEVDDSNSYWGFYRNHMQEVIRFFEMHYKAYCTIDGIPVDVLITEAAQNRAVEGDLVAITVDPVVYWTRMKGPNIACNPVIGGDAVVREVSETNGNHSLKKGQTDASCRFENSSNGLPVLDRMHYHHKNSGFSQAVKCENGHATVPESYEKDLEGKTEAARALQRICSMIYSHPSRRPTG